MKTADKSASCQIFVWRRTSVLRDHFALRTGDHELAVLRIGGLAGPVAHLDVGDDPRLIFLSDGLAGRCIRVRDPSTRVTVAMYERNWHGVGGRLQLADCGQLRWRRAGGLRSPDRMFTNAEGDALARFTTDGTVRSFVAENPVAASTTPDLLLVLALGWLLIVCERARIR